MKNFDATPYHIEIVFEGASTADFGRGLHLPARTLELSQPSDAEKREFGAAFSAWLASSAGHECNGSCRPPYSHYSKYADNEMRQFLSMGEG